METNLLKNWHIEPINKGCIVIGEIYNDIKKRFENGELIWTSRVIKIDFVNGIVETKNSVYHLNKEND